MVNLGYQLPWIWNQLRDSPVGGSVREFPRRWTKEPLSKFTAPSHQSIDIRRSTGPAVALCPIAFTPCLWTHLFCCCCCGSFVDVRSQLLWPSDVDWRLIALHEYFKTLVLGCECWDIMDWAHIVTQPLISKIHKEENKKHLNDKKRKQVFTACQGQELIIFKVCQEPT